MIASPRLGLPEHGGCKVYDGPEFRHLRYFVAVAEECNFNRAARRLRVAQPSLSTQIRQLEEGLDAKLFTRSSAGTSLTPAGSALLPHARQMLLMREQAVQHTALAKSGHQIPFRFGYSPWINQELIHEAIIGYKELVPGGGIDPSSQSSGPLTRLVLDGQLSAALINLPVDEPELYIQFVCSEKLLLCIRSDDPLAKEEAIPRAAVQDRLRVMFQRSLHPLLFDQIERKLAKVGVKLLPTDFVSHPSDMRFLVKEGVGFGLVRDGVPLDPALVRRPIAGVNLSIKGAFICLPAQQRPVLPLLAYRLAKFCLEMGLSPNLKKPAGSVPQPILAQARLFR